MTAKRSYLRLLALLASLALLVGAIEAGSMAADHIRAATAADLALSGFDLCAEGSDSEDHVHCDYCQIAFSADLPQVVAAQVESTCSYQGDSIALAGPTQRSPRWLRPPSTAPPALI